MYNHTHSPEQTSTFTNTYKNSPMQQPLLYSASAYPMQAITSLFYKYLLPQSMHLFFKILPLSFDSPNPYSPLRKLLKSFLLLFYLQIFSNLLPFYVPPHLAIKYLYTHLPLRYSQILFCCTIKYLLPYTPYHYTFQSPTTLIHCTYNTSCI